MQKDKNCHFDLIKCYNALQYRYSTRNYFNINFFLLIFKSKKGTMDGAMISGLLSSLFITNC